MGRLELQLLFFNSDYKVSYVQDTCVLQNYPEICEIALQMTDYFPTASHENDKPLTVEYAPKAL
jgi:hypothetical protein